MVIILETGSKNKLLTFLVSEQERELIERNMERAGIRGLGAYLRKIAIDGYIVQLDLSDVKELVRLLSKVSNNLNQIARRANETRSIYEADIKDLQERYDQLWKTAEGIMLKLSKL